MMKVPPPMQPAPPTSCHVPVMLLADVSFPVSVSVLPAGEVDVTTKLIGPSTTPPESVVRVDVPVSVSESKQATSGGATMLLKLNCETLNEPSPLTVKFMMKLNTGPDATPLPPAITDCHKPLVTALALLALVVVLPQPPTANSQANKTSTANFFIAVLEIGFHLKIQRCALTRQWM
jgi:hypothetical protein